MSRSHRHTPITGWAGTPSRSSEQRDKALAQRRLRRRIRMRIGDEVLPLLREVSDVWCFDKDGKRYRTQRGAPWYAKAMRK